MLFKCLAPRAPALASRARAASETWHSCGKALQRHLGAPAAPGVRCTAAACKGRSKPESAAARPSKPEAIIANIIFFLCVARQSPGVRGGCQLQGLAAASGSGCVRVRGLSRRKSSRLLSSGPRSCALFSAPKAQHVLGAFKLIGPARAALGSGYGSRKTAGQARASSRAAGERPP